MESTPTTEAPTVSSQPVEGPGASPIESAAPQKTTKNHKILLWCLGILAVIGIAAAITFAVLYFSNSAPNPAAVSLEENNPVTQTEEEIVVDANSIDNKIAQNLINPYIKDYYFLNNIFDHDFSEEAKVEIAFLNVPLSYSYPSEGAGVYRVSYYSLNGEYQRLFGNESTLSKQNYNTDYTAKFTYDNSGNSFIIEEPGSGGTAATAFSIVKNAYYDGNDLVVEVYHDTILLCDANQNGGYCYNTEDVPITSQNSIFEKFASQIPTYKMIFTKGIDNYILKDVQK